jgi:hypothetical protein
MSNKLDIGISADFDGTTDDLCIEIDATGFYSIAAAKAAVEKINEAISLAQKARKTAKQRERRAEYRSMKAMSDMMKYATALRNNHAKQCAAELRAEKRESETAQAR